MEKGELLGSSKVTKRFSVVIPDEARKKFKIKTGSRVVFRDYKGMLIITNQF